MAMPHTNHKKTENAASTVKFSPYKTPKNFVWRLQTPNKAQKPQNFAIHRTICISAFYNHYHFRYIFPGLRNGPFRTLIWPISRADMVHFGLWYGLFRDAKKALSQIDRLFPALPSVQNGLFERPERQWIFPEWEKWNVKSGEPNVNVCKEEFA